MKKKNLVLLIVASLVLTISLVVSIPFVILGVKTTKLEADYSYLKTDEKYSQKVEVKEIELVKQHVSCGYATIEMLSTFYGDRVTEDDLNSRNSSISTSSSKGFLDEVNKSIPNMSFVMKSYLSNDVFLKEIYGSLSKNNPVALEWAAKYENEWTLHFSIISSLDLINDQVTVYNPYGYIENISISELIERASFKAYKNMPLFLNFGFAFGAFDKNTIFFAQ